MSIIIPIILLIILLLVYIYLGHIISFSLKNRKLILFLSASFLIIGVVTFVQMPIDAFPDVTNTEITIITQWPGRSAEEVEKFVTIPLEIALNPVQNRTSLRSTSIFGLSFIKIIFNDDVVDKDARQQVMQLLPNANLPTNIQPTLQPPTGPTGEVFRYTLRSTFRTVTELKTIQDWDIDRQLRSVPGIGDINSFGGKTKAFEIKVDPQKLKNLGLTALDVFTAVQKTNINVGGDMIIQNNQAFVVRGIGLLSDIEEIRNIIINSTNGVPLLVKDIATVEISNIPRLGFVSKSEATLESNGSRKVTDEGDVVEAIIVMRKGENPSKVIEALKAKIEYINEYVLPADTKIVPYYDRTTLIEYATHTVIHNLTEGILLVVLLVLLFLFDWRATIIVAVVIPMSLFSAFILLNLMGMSANLLSLGAVDFGILLDGTIVLVEGIYVALDYKAQQVGMDKFNKMSKLGLIKQSATKIAQRPFFLALTILVALLPIFSFEKVEGKMFHPLSWALCLALFGSLITTLTLVPALIAYLLNRNVREKHNFIIEPAMNFMVNVFEKAYQYKKTVIVFSVILTVLGISSFKYLGSEFLPQLNEGSIWLRVQTDYSTSLEKSVGIGKHAKNIIMQFPQVKCCAMQTGRPDNGTDVTGFYNNEFDIILYPESEWKPKISKDELIKQMNNKLSVIPGINLNFSQPIMDNIEEAVSGVKGSICVKVYGDSLNYMEDKINDVYNVMKNINGVEDLGVIHNIGMPELNIKLDQRKMALYGVSTADASAVISMAIGGLGPGGAPATTLYEGVKTFDVRIRLPEEFRNTPEKIGELLVPTSVGSQVPLKEIALFSKKTGASLIFRDENRRYATLKFSVRGRDMGSTIAEAQAKVEKAITLKRGYRIAWQGDFENQQRAEKRLLLVVPISLVLIFFVLFSMFKNFKDSLLVFINVPFAIVGGIVALYLTQTHFSISAGIGFICLFGICLQDGIILITMFKDNLEEKKKLSNNYNESINTILNQKDEKQDHLFIPIKNGVRARVRPVMMTALMAAIGLLPAAASHGIGSESAQPLARVVIGGILFAMMFSLWVFPLIFRWSYRNYGNNKLTQNTDN